MKNVLASLSIVPFTQERVANPFPEGDLPWQVYHGVRNALVETCRKYGPTGPMGLVRIVRDVENPMLMLVEDGNFWERGDADPIYFVLDDQLNDERYCYVELLTHEAFSAGWLQSVVRILRQFDGWGVAISNIPDSYLLIFGDRLLAQGRLAKCRSAAELIEVGQRLLMRGPRRWWEFWKR